MELDLYQIDAFTAERFSGNPAAVVPLQRWLSDEVMLNIARENNLSETAFFVPVLTEEADFEIRWFTPVMEVDLCGHATLAASAVIFRHLRWDQPVIRFVTRFAGALTVSREGERFVLDFPSRPAKPVEMPAGLTAALGREPKTFLRAMKNLAVFDGEEDILAIDPDLDFIAGMEGDGLVVTAPGREVDCVSRYFAPHAGIAEDPVTGSAHCTVVPYWVERLGKRELHARQVSKRGGDLYCHQEGDRVLMAGDACLYMKGKILI
ncbi:PhzF family phenazine biosynthesis protein [Aestuariispira insulae]|uniref:PhzF family phenazine biosynthesis protein n=1 Tax=Aestuariispira insulae TaxID=1461337 RepID=A0A3D9HJW2_9PROT|nr:PhzF family phenazine biosynthesis protein [Aestuariispira insulae]RED49802.1 PhzF family phenazine biosynthesis protein [Aestuariispira insulae]